MDTIQSMRVFSRVVEAGSFTVAAQKMNTTTAQTSRSVADLEAHLRTRLLHRTTRRIALTDAGQRYLERCQQILQDIDQAEGEARDAQAKPIGKLRVHSMTSFGIRYLVPLIARYGEKFPAVNVDLTLSQRLPDLLEDGFDVSLSLAKELADSNHVSQRIGSSFSVACASPAYLERYGVPGRPSDLDKHTCVQLVTPVGGSDTWVFNGDGDSERYKLKGNTFRVNIPEALAAGVAAGMGVGVLPVSSIGSELASERLVRVLPEYKLDELNIYAIYPSRQYLDAKIKTWIEFLRDELPAALDRDAALLESRGVSVV
ncbi:LysR family transcriptional regulator [Paraburkholderia sediminicola]|uniref:LysR family transcriptional regulator n=1 Tax=Paraburkholderia sediminicola TaxID=458836 RepID=UPI0038BA04F1